MVPVLLFISLQMPGMFGPVEKLLTRPPSKTLSLFVITFALKAAPSAQAIVMVPLLPLIIEQRAARPSLQGVSPLG